MKVDPKRCIEQVYSGLYSVGHIQCKNRPMRDGYCTQHHPEHKAARRKARDEKYAAERAAREAPGKRLAELEARCAEMTEILRSFTASQYIKAQHPIRYSRAMRALGAAK